MQRETLHILDKKKNGSVEFGISTVLDVSGHLREAELAREKEATLQANKKNEYKRVCSVDMVTVMNIRRDYGIDALNLRTPEESRRYLQIIQTEYPKYLTTNKKVYRAPEGKRKFANIPPECLA